VLGRRERAEKLKGRGGDRIEDVQRRRKKED